ncbi:MAG: ABC transporter permease [Myxococcales bacterium]|nr:ABC transporter permease [Myxococcales bacterium]
MRFALSARYAVRGLGRHVRRTLLSALGVGIGCAIGLITLAWIRGEEEMIIRAAAECGAGHLRVVPAGWQARRDRSLRLQNWEQTLAHARSLPGVAVATPRTRVQGLLGLGTRVAAAEVVGVDPASEPAALRFVRRIAQGRYLRPGERGTAVVGKKLLTRLDGALDDEVLVTAMDASGQMQSALLRIVGVVETGSDNIDGGLVQVPRADAVQLSGAQGAGEVTILLSDYRQADRIALALSEVVAPPEGILHWHEVAPELLAGYQMDQGFARVTVGLVIVLVLLGVMSAQLASVLERRKEFAVLSALGVSAAQMAAIVLAESLSVGAIGAALGLLIGLPVVYHFATSGIRLAEMMGEGDMALSGVLLDPVMYADLGPWILPHALLLSLTATVFAALYPALYATRTDPADALRVAQ